MSTTTFQPPPTYAEPVSVNEQTKKSQFDPAWLNWFLQITQFINTNGGSAATVNHNALAGLQGGETGQYYHVNATLYDQLVAGGFVTSVTASSPLTSSGGSTPNISSTGFSGTFKTGDLPQRTVTVVNGIITSVA